VRVHADSQAAEMAAGQEALAYTAGSHVVFGAGQYAPGTTAGNRLLAHELAHVAQQSRRGPVSSGLICRQAAPSTTRVTDPTLPPFQVPQTDLTLFPGPFRLFNLQGYRIPLPGSLRLTNALGVGTAPRFVLDMSPHGLIGTILDNVDLSVSTTPGTPPEREPAPENIQRLSLVRPMIWLDPGSGRLTGLATLQVPTGYPLTVRSATELDVRIESSQLGQFQGQISLGPVHADFQLRLRYDTARLEQSLRPVLSPAGGFAGAWERFQNILRSTVPGIRVDSVSDALQTALRALLGGQVDGGAFVDQTLDLIRSSAPANVSLEDVRTAITGLAAELTHPGFTLSGSLGLGGLPLSTFNADAPTTLPLRRPLLGAPAAFPLTYSAGGIILAPPGSITDITVPALGYTRSSFGATSGTAFTAAALPTLSPSAISAGRPFAEQFPVYAYAELSYVRRVGDSVDLGVRLTAQISTAQLFGQPAQPAADPAERFRQFHTQYLESTQTLGTTPLIVPNFGLTVFGRY
jgi:Domain of unknown function (DUF4157)